jgi:hypothetical protein
MSNSVANGEEYQSANDEEAAGEFTLLMLDDKNHISWNQFVASYMSDQATKKPKVTSQKPKPIAISPRQSLPLPVINAVPIVTSNGTLSKPVKVSNMAKSNGVDPKTSKLSPQELAFAKIAEQVGAKLGEVIADPKWAERLDTLIQFKSMIFDSSFQSAIEKISKTSDFVLNDRNKIYVDVISKYHERIDDPQFLKTLMMVHENKELLEDEEKMKNLQDIINANFLVNSKVEGAITLANAMGVCPRELVVLLDNKNISGITQEEDALEIIKFKYGLVKADHIPPYPNQEQNEKYDQ